MAEIAMAIILLSASGLLVRSFLRLTTAHLGFRPAGVLTVRVSLPFTFEYPSRVDQFLAGLLGRTKQMRDVDAAAIGDGLPMGDAPHGFGVLVEGQPPPPPGGAPTIGEISVSPDYFRALGIPVLRGRSFTGADGADAPRVLVVNQAFASRFFPGRDAIGKRITFGSVSHGPWEQIVGVVGNVRQQRLRVSDEPRIYTSYRQLRDPENFLIFEIARTAGTGRDCRKSRTRDRPNRAGR